MPRFTFRNYKKTHWSDSVLTTSEIRLNGEVVGYIEAILHSDKFKIVYQGPASKMQLEHNPNCPWGWKKILLEFESDKAARQWISKNNKKFYEQLYRENEESPKCQT